MVLASARDKGPAMTGADIDSKNTKIKPRIPSSTLV